ncbi:hypothetical protein PGTUg99_033660 [Puccinia graminis f. sp. tritici]|uniref:ER membrane protein complex subunit 10 n=1 Tax=Puccinia graminis f. sp. tritici TaxID=56615 RepID=A0A5B0RUE7_PUCGR|nr:hypothetical protein PGTUg99_033660 [Puccinia graminis f. sp. tritici]
MTAILDSHRRKSEGQRLRLCLVLLGILIISPVSNQASSGSSYALFHRLVQSSIAHTPSSTTATLGGGEWQRRGLLEIVPDDDSLDHFKIASFSNQLVDPLVLPKETLISSGKGWSYQIALAPLLAFNLPGQDPSPDTGFALVSFPLCRFLQDPTSSSQSNGLSSPATRLEEQMTIWLRPRRPIGLANNHPNPSAAAAAEEEEEEEEEEESWRRSGERDLHLDLLGIQWTSSHELSPASSSPTCQDTHHARSSSSSESSINAESPTGSASLDPFLASLSHPQNQSSTLKISLRVPERLSEPIWNPHPTVQPAQLMADGSLKAPAPEKGWLAKYWMYILPVVVMLVVGGGAPPPEEGGGDSTNQQPQHHQ